MATAAQVSAVVPVHLIQWVEKYDAIYYESATYSIFLKRSFITLFILFKVVRFESLPDTLRTLTISYQLLHRVYLIQETCY